jgi:phthalate 4,5-dioxygenase
MLTAKETKMLTEVGKGKPMGEFMRRYWIPAAKSEEVPTAGGAPARVKLLGEQLVLFRSGDGELGLIDEFCPHRRASLAYGRNESGGLRCLYHGWKVACDGRVIESPPEPPARTFAKKLSVASYPGREAGGLIWTYMGPPDLEPPFPKFPWLGLPPDRLLVVKMYQATNYLQGVEGDLDPAHPNYLHREIELDEKKSWAGAGWQSIVDIMSDGSPEIQCEETPYLMRHAAIRKTADPDSKYVRVFEWVAPFYCYIATGAHESQLFKAWHPIDDENCFTFYIHFDPERPLDIEAIYANWEHRTSPPDYRTAHTVANMYLQDRKLMEHGNFSGVMGAAIQDRAMQEGMGPICDRTKEHLGTSDKAVIFYRRLLLKKLDDLAKRKPLPARDPSLTFDQRGYSSKMPADQPWCEVAKWQAKIAQQRPPVAAE